ncbi:hypothetical protein FHP29_01445 [Nocardioides albidus]|uniref:Uncharacterized protein n=1 Tax=Nocardioides albidus TaxID=1517589 RepID=A0A5C4WNR9_9ACTN|nr:hypothetical protein [Nocardioides albidus]TNM49543.1 hypothetical protein FHP29_01445 [Nocardioides albidus]
MSVPLIRPAAAVLGAAAIVLVGAGAASAHECINISKQNQAAGVQIVFSGDDFSPIWISSGLQKRIDAGLVDLDTGDGFRGLIGIDFDGDSVVDVSSFIVGPDGEIPPKAQHSGAPCNGVVNIQAYFTCMDG